MKNEINYYKFPEMEKKVADLLSKLDKDCNEYNRSTIRTTAANYGIKNLPLHDEVNIEPFIEQARGFFMVKNTDISLALKGAIQQELSEMNATTADGELQGLEKEHRKLIEENKRDHVDLERLSTEVDKNTAKKFNTMLAVLSIAEAIGYTFSYIQLGDSLILSIVFGGLLGFAATYGTKFFVIYLRDKVKNNLSWKSKLLYSSLFASALFALASLRFWASLGNKSAVSHSPVALMVYIMVTLLLVGVVAGITYLYYPNKEEERVIHEHDSLESKIAERTKKIKELDVQISKVKSDINAVTQLHRIVEVATADLHKRIEAYFKEAVGGFKFENQLKRTDGKMPVCFTQPISPLVLDSPIPNS